MLPACLPACLGQCLQEAGERAVERHTAAAKLMIFQQSHRTAIITQEDRRGKSGKSRSVKKACVYVDSRIQIYVV